MNLLEHHAKALLDSYGLPVPNACLVVKGEPTPDSLTFPRVAKSQVPVGGRGKAGGIVSVDSSQELPQVLNTLFSLAIQGHEPTAILLEEQVDAHRELYLSLRLNRDARRIEWLASTRGGVDIESQADSIHVVPASEGVEALPELLGVEPGVLTPLLQAMTRVFKENDLLLLEINPLIEKADASLVCADAKCLVDDNARFRHPDLPWPPERGNPPLALGGTIGCIANGAGMAMSTMDTVVSMGGRPANFLDIGGGTGEKEFVVALKNVAALSGVKSIIINIFAGISRCDEIARGIIAARDQLSDLPPLFIRLEGTNRDVAVQLLTKAHIKIEPDLRTCVQKAMDLPS